MLQRLRNLLAAAFDKDDVVILMGLALLSIGVWQISPSATFIIDGAVLLWVFLPPRPPFIDRPPATKDRRP